MSTVKFDRKMLNEAVKTVINRVLKENAPMRDVRHIIIANILCKHPEFKWNSGLAWAYYTYAHQRNREGLGASSESILPEDLMKRMFEALKLGNEERARQKMEIKNRGEAAKKAVSEWLANPENSKMFDIDFDPTQYDLETEEGCYEALLAAEKFEKEYGQRRGNVDFKFDNGAGVEKSGETSIVANQSQREDARRVVRDIKSILLDIQRKYGEANFDMPLYWSENATEPMPKAYAERKEMADSDEMAQWYVSSSGRCWASSFCPKYMIGWDVDSSD